MYTLRQRTQSINFIKLYKMTEEESLIQSYMLEEEENDNYSPYCPVCTGCGESGCCSPKNCDPYNINCHYPETYTADLRLGYATFERWYDLLDQNDWFGKKEEFMKIYHEELDIRFGKDGE